MNTVWAWFKKCFIAGAIFGLAFVVGCTVPGLVRMGLFDNLFDNRPETPDIVAGEKVNILFLGVDARPGEQNTRSDTMILATVDPNRQRVAMVSIPRDSRVEINGRVDKINAANALGGPAAACKAVEKLLETRVDYYVLTNFQGFAACVDILGGVNIDVEKRMYKPSEGINLKPGPQHLNGKQALAYVRFRGDALADISRTERQQKFIMAFANEMFQTKNVLKLPALIPELAPHVKTNMGIKEMITLASLAKDFNPQNMVCQTLPGYFYDDEQGISYWIVNRSKAVGLLDSLLDGCKVAVLEESPVVSKPQEKKTPVNQGSQTQPGGKGGKNPTGPKDPQVPLPDDDQIGDPGNPADPGGGTVQPPVTDPPQPPPVVQPPPAVPVPQPPAGDSFFLPPVGQPG